MNASDEVNKKIGRFSDLNEEMAKYINNVTLHPNFLFRGQGDVRWSLEPSFARLANRRKLKREKALQLEREIVNKFSISARKLMPLKNTITLQGGPAIDFLGWFVIMQHFCAPTWSLDWTSSPWVALYFSCFEKEKSDGILWIADFKKVDEYAKNKLKEIKVVNKNREEIKDPYAKIPFLLTNSKAPEILVFLSAFNTNERIEAQQGRFSVCTNPLADHKGIIEAAGSLSKIEIPKELKPTIMKELYKMNISAKTLFPGIDGLGKSIYEYCNLWDVTSIIK
jgi:hypothetical protein